MDTDGGGCEETFEIGLCFMRKRAEFGFESCYRTQTAKCKIRPKTVKPYFTSAFNYFSSNDLFKVTPPG